MTAAGVKGLALGFDVVRPPSPGVAVLAYHRVGAGTALGVDLEPSLFADQMQHLVASCEVTRSSE